MARIDIPDGDDVERMRLWRMAPSVAKGIDAMRAGAYGEQLKLSSREQEVARMRIAQINDCDI